VEMAQIQWIRRRAQGTGHRVQSPG
jgi:hypothetical protein